MSSEFEADKASNIFFMNYVCKNKPPYKAVNICTSYGNEFQGLLYFCIVGPVHLCFQSAANGCHYMTLSSLCELILNIQMLYLFIFYAHKYIFITGTATYVQPKPEH